MRPRNPFLYPTIKHKRGPDPGPYQVYASYKPYLRREFKGKCVYCRMPDTLVGRPGFSVDHYRPKSRFPQLATDYRNLYYACGTCNSSKGSFWPSVEQRIKGVFVPNPCEHVMVSHLKYVGSSVDAKSTAGRFTRDLLKLNADQVVEQRRFYQRLIDDKLSLVAVERERVGKVDSLLARERGLTRRAQLAADKTKREGRIQQLLADVQTLVSPVP